MKLSIVTATFNRASLISECFGSLRSQSHQDYEHIVQDGASSDETMALIARLGDDRTHAVSEPDGGLYDALNKAISRATGEVIGLLHSDDMFAHADVLARISDAFADPEIDAVYADLHYVMRRNPEKVVRNWVSGPFTPDRLKAGWMPPHPTVFLRRSVFERFGLYDTTYEIAADYDAMLRYFGSPGFRAVYVPEVFVKMRLGGVSNASLRHIVRKSREDYRALRRNGVGGLGVLVRKNSSKLGQFFAKP